MLFHAIVCTIDRIRSSMSKFCSILFVKIIHFTELYWFLYMAPQRKAQIPWATVFLLFIFLLANCKSRMMGGGVAGGVGGVREAS